MSFLVRENLLMSLAVSSALFFAQYSSSMQQQQQVEKQAMETSSQTEQERIRLELASGTLEVDKNTLENMKSALLSFLKKPEAEFPAQYLEVRDYFRQELESSASWIDGNIAGIGGWRLENRDGNVELVRYPPPSDDDMYIFHATLERRDSEWQVISFELEREFGPH